MDVPEAPLKLDIETAATRQTEGAIEAFASGKFDIAITLAGAAEGMIERRGPHMFSYLLDSERIQHVPRKDWIAALNAERDWLKHGGKESIVIERGHAAFMIARAASKLEKWTPRMEEFRVWINANVERL